jgi:hypothetical protein
MSKKNPAPNTAVVLTVFHVRCRRCHLSGVSTDVEMQCRACGLTHNTWEPVPPTKVADGRHLMNGRE